jgi:hypothetical protein
MSLWLIIVVTAIYLFTAVDQLIKGNTGVGIMFFGYAFANVGVLFQIKA